jgi:NAD(P)-dependent dehydrogenase (short-subunit alcohol dehydrogenase family)
MTNKTIVITGASSGIGAGLAERLGRDGHQLVLAARRRPELEQVAGAATAAGASAAVVVPTNVIRRVDVDALARAAVDRFGGFDVWINNSGRGITRSVLDLTDEDVDEMIAINVKSALYGVQAAARHFVERGHGHIINVSSFLGRVPMALPRSAYSAAKAALNSLTANARVELRIKNPNIHVTLVMPGMVATEFGRNARNAPPDTGLYSGAHVQTVEQVADVIARTLDNPIAEVYTNPMSAEMARRYVTDVESFETSENPWVPSSGGAR